MAAVVVALGLFVFMWSSGTSPHLIAAWSGFALLYFLFAAPTVCGAYTRAGGRCRNNVQGVLRGCHIRQHGKAKRARLLRDGIGRQRTYDAQASPGPHRDRQLSRRDARSWSAHATYIVNVAGAVGSFISGLAALGVSFT